jgi:AAA+ ATPase superfamily predicted ATPase
MERIPFNPYIVGNPIKTKEMFFGRQDDFNYVVKKIGGAKSNQVLVFCGERRSGKTSILFQILNGRLGERFLPVLVDMQILAGIKTDDHFWRTVLKVACNCLQLPDLTVNKLEEISTSGRVEELFDTFLFQVEQSFPGKIVLFLLDEYELIEEKIRDGSLSESTIHYLSGVLESPHNISFVFTGSTNLENRKVSFWKSLLGKSIYRKISYLSANDTARLITQPLKDYIHYSPELIAGIYRLSGGQPFYTQVICQNLVDRLMEEQRSDPSEEDLEAIVKGIVDNPLPQMIYSWNSLSDGNKILLSSLAGVLDGPQAWAGPAEVMQYFRQSKLGLPYKREEILILLEETYHKEYLEKQENNLYRFRMDLPRQWIRREHSIWKVAKEVGLKPKKRIRPALLAAVAIAVAGAGAGIWYFLLRPKPMKPEIVQPVEQQIPAQKQIEEIVLRTNAGPFRVTIDGSLNLTSEGLENEQSIVVPSLSAGSHRFVFLNPATGEQRFVQADIGESSKQIAITFEITERVASAAAASSSSSGRAAAGTGSGRAEKRAGEEGEEAASSAEVGTLFITSLPVAARIFLDGENTGSVTPTLFEDLNAGPHTLSLVLAGYKEASLEIEISAGDTIKQEVTLVESFGEVIFDVRPTAKILLDGEPLIETPYVQPVKIPSGQHVITIINESLGVRKIREIEVLEGQTITVAEVLK